MKRFQPILWKVGILAALALGISWWALGQISPAPRLLASIPTPFFGSKLPRAALARSLGRRHIRSQDLSGEDGRLTFQHEGKTYHAKLTLDMQLQQAIEAVYERYDPAFAAFVAIDPNTGRILALADHSQTKLSDNLALRASYPAASVFKVVTSAAALEVGKVDPHSLVGFNGSASTLYKRNLRDTVNRWTRFISVEDALAHSVNTVFGKLAVNRLGTKTLQKYANAFGFNQNIEFDLPVDSSTALVPEDSYGLAEAGSGFTRRQTLSPVQGATLAAAIINDGVMPNPHLVEEVLDEDGRRVYRAQQKSISFPVEKRTARQLALMMENTILRGTARRQYRDYNHHPLLSKIFIGAKTGSLSGDNPEGKYDWFVGFAQSSENPKKKIAFASLIVNKAYWRVKSSQVAREGIIHYFKRQSI